MQPVTTLLKEGSTSTMYIKGIFMVIIMAKNECVQPLETYGAVEAALQLF